MDPQRLAQERNGGEKTQEVVDMVHVVGGMNLAKIAKCVESGFDMGDVLDKD